MGAVIVNVVSWGMTVGGLCLPVLVVRGLLKTRRKRQAGVEVPGVVADWVRNDYRTAWLPLLEFTTLDGRPVRTRASTHSWVRGARSGVRPEINYPRGAEVMITYDPAQPTDAMITKQANGGCLIALFTFIGLGLALIGGILRESFPT